MEAPILITPSEMSKGLGDYRPGDRIWLYYSVEEWKQLTSKIRRAEKDQLPKEGQIALTSYYVGGQVIAVPKAFGGTSQDVEARHTKEGIEFSRSKASPGDPCYLVLTPTHLGCRNAGGAQHYCCLVFDGTRAYCYATSTPCEDLVE